MKSPRQASLGGGAATDLVQKLKKQSYQKIELPILLRSEFDEVTGEIYNHTYGNGKNYDFDYQVNGDIIVNAVA